MNENSKQLKPVKFEEKALNPLRRKTEFNLDLTAGKSVKPGKKNQCWNWNPVEMKFKKQQQTRRLRNSVTTEKKRLWFGFFGRCRWRVGGRRALRAATFFCFISHDLSTLNGRSDRVIFLPSTRCVPQFIDVTRQTRHQRGRHSHSSPLKT